MKLYVGVKAVIVEAGKVLLIQEGKYDEGTNEGSWDVPGGRINPEEPLLFGLQREVREECGLEVEIGELLAVNETFPVINSETCHIVRLHYVCTPLSHEVRLGAEHTAYEWVGLDALEGREYVSDLYDFLKKIPV